MPTNAAIHAIEYYLPDKVVRNCDLAAEFPEWSVEKIQQKTGISERHICGENECASDLAVAAAQKLFQSGACGPAEIDFVLLCTQSPDHFLPTTACLVQDRLGIPVTAGALDFNLGCSGFIYGLGLAKGLVETGQARKVLLITAETYSKFIHPGDKSVRTLFGDAAAVTLVAATETPQPCMGPFIYGSDGSGGPNLIVPTGGTRQSRTVETSMPVADTSGNLRSRDNLFMNGGEIFTFTLQVVPTMVSNLLRQSSLSLEDIDLFVFHQANQFMLDHLRKRIKIPSEKFCIALSHCGNTVSSTIPIALKAAMGEGRLQPGHLIMLVGFGVGYSWGATLVRWVV